MESERIVRMFHTGRQAFDIENAHLTPCQRDQKWAEFCTIILTEAQNPPPVASSLPTSLVDHRKRSSTMAQLDLESGPKRSAAFHDTSAPLLERRRSGPASTSHAMHLSASLDSDTSAQTKPIAIPKQQRKYNNRRLSTSCTSFSGQNFHPTSLGQIAEVHDYSPDDFLAQSPDSFVAPSAFSFGAVSGFGSEYQAQPFAQLAVPSYQFDDTNSPQSPYTATSDSGMTTGSTAAYSAPMTRNNTNEQICGPFAMFGVDTEANTFRAGSTRNIPFPITFPYFSSVMKPTLSLESVSSSVSSSGVDPVVDQAPAPKTRAIAPKKQNDVSNPQPKIVAFTADDGTVKQKAAIPRTTRQQVPRKTTFCEFCNEQPSGFHGDHELRRHIERHHTQIRRVWICRDASTDGTFLSNCKACRNKKTYGANYNAAAHLRRAHFNPCKNRRGGRGKKSENRGGKGGGNSPSMEFLKNWMYESLELNAGDKIIVQNLAPDVNFSQDDIDQIIDYNQEKSPIDLDFELDLDPAAIPMSNDQPEQYAAAYPPMPAYSAPMSYPQPHPMPVMQQQPHPFYPQQYPHMGAEMPMHPPNMYDYYH